MSKGNIQGAAKRLVWLLKKEGIIVQRYDAITTQSIYLKLDFGMCNSIRISDHRGKKHLAYRYNLIKGHRRIETQNTKQGWDRHYYPIDNVKELVEKIVEDRSFKVNCYGESCYRREMMQRRDENIGTAGFWRSARLV